MYARAVAATALICALTCGAVSASPSKQRPVPPKPRETPMTFYVVNGAADACGHGCDSWIEVEGKVESDTATRFRAFLDRHHDRNLPIYFASPGGNLDQAIAMGTFLHGKSSIARVGRTMVQECGFEAQDSDVCVKLKQSGRELHGDLFTSGAICASACPYAFMGAAVHEIAPDAILAIHSPKVVLNFRGGQPDAIAIAAANQRGRERADRVASAYLAKMGIDAGLLALTRTIKFEDIHVLTRDEIARFGIDRREAVETPWRFESNALNSVRKIAVVKTPGDTSFRLLQWRVTCFNSDNFSFDFQRPTRAGALVAIAHGGGSPVYFNGPLSVGGGSSFEQWGMRLIHSRLESLVGQPQTEIIETSLASDGRSIPQTTRLSNEGWAHAMESLLASCPPARGAVIVHSSEAASK
ncbi:hypothetical protein SAMN05444170_5634 [Bradyrhizobium erythrophlei]|jgi:hypothetical protein|uniref:Uncharacterized protein n=2 Tax=Bradyrhizobium erythrophlei TaxID=1437360 RepID=A0A1M7ULL0_9BRAD|nr:hypothetical protein SAMN05444170_5634 [Bradyrhizobium erythrophlei]